MSVQLQRLADNGQQARTTIRMLESLIRIAQAHARIMCHGEVSLVDAIVAVTVMESSMQVRDGSSWSEVGHARLSAPNRGTCFDALPFLG